MVTGGKIGNDSENEREDEPHLPGGCKRPRGNKKEWSRHWQT